MPHAWESSLNPSSSSARAVDMSILLLAAPALMALILFLGTHVLLWHVFVSDKGVLLLAKIAGGSYVVVAIGVYFRKNFYSPHGWIFWKNTGGSTKTETDMPARRKEHYSGR